MKETIGNVILNYQYYSGKDLYSDGPIEDELLEAARTCSENELEAFIEKEGRWEFLYHFSEIRHNIVDGLNITKSQKVLEIGSGCGAVTGALAAKAGSVTCIELSKKRSLINANRNRSRENIEILVGNFADIEPELTEKYDYITLIGVYEYAALYIPGDRPYYEFLVRIKQHLKPDGKIVIAIENKLGLKYWAGCPEDHTGALFDGIAGYANVTNVKTFTQKELEEIFCTVGLKKWEFYYPHPDYKFPFAIYSDDRLPQEGELEGNYDSFDRIRVRLFDEGKVFDNIIKNGLYPVFANSYLVIVGSGEMKPEKIEARFYEGAINIPKKEEYTMKELLDAKRKCDGYIPLQVFWDYGKGFSEENSKITEIKPDRDGVIRFYRQLPKGIKRFRIDPGNDACIIKLRVYNDSDRLLEVSECNGNILADGSVRFENEDPWAVYEGESLLNGKIRGELRYKCLDKKSNV